MVILKDFFERVDFEKIRREKLPSIMQRVNFEASDEIVTSLHRMMRNFACFLSSADVFKTIFSKKSFRNNIIRVSNSFDPDQVAYFEKF